MSWRAIAVSVALLAPLALLGADDPPKPKRAKPEYVTRKDHDRDGIGKFYMGREIAQVMGHEAADWLDRPEREKEENPAKLMEVLPLQAGTRSASPRASGGASSTRR